MKQIPYPGELERKEIKERLERLKKEAERKRKSPKRKPEVNESG